jgi:hypothetical protein
VGDLPPDHTSSPPRGVNGVIPGAVAAGSVAGAILGGGLLTGIVRSGAGPALVLLVELAAFAALSVVPLAVLAAAAVLVHPRSRAWLAREVSTHLERRHAVRLAAAETPARHLHLGGQVAASVAEQLRREQAR